MSQVANRPAGGDPEAATPPSRTNEFETPHISPATQSASMDGEWVDPTDFKAGALYEGLTESPPCMTAALRCEATVIPNEKAVETAPSSVVASETPAGDKWKKKEPQDKWTRKEEASFFEELKVHGNDFTKITKRVQSKNHNQVRFYYVRLLNKINKVLQPLEISVDGTNNDEVHAAMLSWNIRSAQRPMKQKVLALGLKKDLEQHRRRAAKKAAEEQELEATQECSATASGDGDYSTLVLEPISPPSKASMMEASPHTTVSAAPVPLSDVNPNKEQHPNGRACSEHPRDSATSTPGEAHAASGPGRALSAAQTGSDAPPRLLLQLVPLDQATRSMIARAGHNPNLELTIGPKKKVRSVLKHMREKWASAETPAVSIAAHICTDAGVAACSTSRSARSAAWLMRCAR
ncbi:TSL-kinase interacting protein, partial [Cymbomonas tetramitiformis]